MKKRADMEQGLMQHVLDVFVEPYYRLPDADDALAEFMDTQTGDGATFDYNVMRGWGHVDEPDFSEELKRGTFRVYVQVGDTPEVLFQGDFSGWEIDPASLHIKQWDYKPASVPPPTAEQQLKLAWFCQHVLAHCAPAFFDAPSVTMLDEVPA